VIFHGRSLFERLDPAVQPPTYLDRSYASPAAPVAAGTVTEYGGTAFTVEAGDGHRVQVVSSVAEFHVNRTPYLLELVLGAGMSEPVVLRRRPQGEPHDPYWQRAAHAWKRRTARKLVLYAGGPLEDAVEAAARSRSAGIDPVVVDLTGEGDLQARYPWLGVRGLHEYAAGVGVRDARSRAAEWMQGIPLNPLSMSSLSFLETIQDDGVPRWWRFEISLQERAFLSVRLVETIREIVRVESIRSAVIVGGAEGGWMTECLLATCRAEDVAVVQVGTPVGPPDPLRGRYRRRWRHVEATGSTGNRLFVPLVTKATALLVGAVLVPTGLIASVFAAVVLVPLRLAYLSLTYVRTGAVPSGGLRRALRLRSQPLSKIQREAATDPVGAVRLMLPALVAVVAWLSFIVAIWVAPGLVLAAVVVVVVVALVFYMLFVVAAPRYLDLRGTVRWPMARGRELRNSLGPKRIVRSLLHGRSRRPSAASGRARVALLVDEGNVRTRRSASRKPRGTYNSYFEGVEAAFQSLPDTSVVVISYGDPIGSRSTAGWIGQIVGRLRPAARIKLRSYLHPTDLERADIARSSSGQQLAILEADSGFRAPWRYPKKGSLTGDVDLWPALRKQFEEGYQLAPYAVAYETALGRVLDLIHADLVVTYNFEGVFRRQLPAVIKRGIPLLGVQQALGPYVHGLGPSRAGRDRPLARRRLGVPMPDRIAVWGERDLQLLTSYGHAGDTLALTGYPRSDTFVNEKGRTPRERVLRRLDLPPDARVIIYSAVLRVLGGPLIRDEQWFETLAALVGITREFPGLYVIVKPWPGDDTERIRILMDAVADERVRYVDPGMDLHNVDLLGVADAVVGTFSSLLGEALLAGAVAVLMNFPEARYYFGDEVERYSRIAVWASSPRGAARAVRRIMAGGSAYRERFVESAMPDLRYLFGPLDGHSAERVVTAGMDLSKRVRR